MVHLELPRNAEGVCQMLLVILGGAGTGKTTMLSAWAPHLAPPERETIASPIGALAQMRPELRWIRITAENKSGVDRLFRPLVPLSKDEPQPPKTFLLLDEFDELCTPQGYLTPSIYNFINYGRNFGHGAALCARGSADITKNAIQSAQLVLIAQTTEPNALRYLNDWLTDPAQPEIDYKAIIKVLPSNPEDGFVFLCWVPRAARKFQGYLEVKDGRIQPWTPDRLKRRAGPDDAETDATETLDGDGETDASDAPVVSGPSATGPDPGTVDPASSRSAGKTSAPGKPGSGRASR